MALAIPNDVQSRHLGEPLDADALAVIGVRLGDVERMLKNRISDLLTKAAADPEYTENVKYVESEAVLRLIRNPDGFTQETDGNYSYMVSQKVASGRLEILDTEWQLLGLKRGVFSIAPKLNLPWSEPGVDTVL